MKQIKIEKKSIKKISKDPKSKRNQLRQSQKIQIGKRSINICFEIQLEKKWIKNISKDPNGKEINYVCFWNPNRKEMN